jgi:hypothetical protein
MELPGKTATFYGLLFTCLFRPNCNLTNRSWSTGQHTEIGERRSALTNDKLLNYAACSVIYRYINVLHTYYILYTESPRIPTYKRHKLLPCWTFRRKGLLTKIIAGYAMEIKQIYKSLYRYSSLMSFNFRQSFALWSLWAQMCVQWYCTVFKVGPFLRYQLPSLNKYGT